MASSHDLSAHAHHEEEEEHNRSGERRTRWVVALTAIMMVGELIVGWMTGSLSLTADGWHMGTHVGALGLTLAAYWYARKHAGNDVFSFGTGKVYALAGYTSGIVLAIVALWMGVEAALRLAHRSPVDFADALPVAVIGLGVNLVCALLLGHGHGHDHGHQHDHAHEHGHDHAHGPPRAHDHGDHNLKAAYLHVVADAL